MIDFIRVFPAGKVEYCCLPYKHENGTAKKLYASFGYIDSDEVINGENISVLKLSNTN